MEGVIILAVMAIFAVPALGNPVATSPVFELNDANFGKMLKDKKVMLVDFYAPWCSDCARLAPEYEIAARDLARERKFVMAKIDCFGAGKGTCDGFGVRKWPTLKMFRYGRYVGDYTYKEDRVSLKSYMDLMLKQNPGPKPISDQPQEHDPNGPNLNPFRPWTWSEPATGWSFGPMNPGCAQPCG